MTSKTKVPISLLITDLDNTLWDWFDSWYAAFSTLLEGLVERTGVPRVQLENEAREIHRTHGTTEYSWLLYEMPSVREYCGVKDPFVVLDDLLHRQNAARLNAIELYEGVRSTLNTVKHQGVPIVAYTESQSYWTQWRIQKVGLDGVIDTLYSSHDHDTPGNFIAEEKRHRPEIDFSLEKTRHKHVPTGALKPNPDIIRGILEEFVVPKEHTLYVGDNLIKDVAMAQKAGIIDAHAAYGMIHEAPAYEQLRRVSHWSLDDIEKEKWSTFNPSVNPTYTLRGGFNEILDFFEFSQLSRTF